ncbi:MAG: hypothetical protein CMJ44_17435 [Pimelobacter sp.]|nr:hypothetical protein [Pimelobacter sp.]
MGAALSHASGAAKLYEPLNPESGLRSVHEYFVFPESAGQHPGSQLDRQLREVFGVSVRMRRGIWPEDPAWKKAVKQVTGNTTRVSAVKIRLDPRVDTVIWKDPFASFLVPYLSSYRGISSIVTVRPPEAAAASFKRLGWTFDLDRVHAQLTRLTPGAAYLVQEPEWAGWVKDPPMIGALLWRMVYGYLDTVLPRSDGPPAAGAAPVLWSNSRRLLAEPLETYTRFFKALDLDLSPRVREAILRDYRDEGSTEPSSKTHDRARNVTQANSYWRRVLEPTEENTVRQITADVRSSIERRVGELA